MPVKTTALQEYLQRFYPVTEAELEKIREKLKVRELRSREKLIDEGQVETHVYLVVKGLLRKYFRKDEQEVVLGFYKERDICHGAISYFTGLPSSCIIAAMEPVTLLALHRNDLDALLEEVPGMEVIFRNVLSEIFVKQYNNRIDQKKYNKQERFLHFCETEPELLRRVPQKQLASYLEIAPETFCRMKHVRYKLAKEGRLPNTEN